jgi:predicted nucleotidyltransferase
MANLFNEDFQDFLKALNAAEVEYILVGGYSVILHGYSRTTGDLDIWVERTENNYYRLRKAFHLFNMPVLTMTLENFLDVENYDVFTYGRQPRAIDIITKLKGLEFAEAITKSKPIEIEGLMINLIHYNDLILSKAAAGRPRDINDIERLGDFKS